MGNKPTTTKSVPNLRDNCNNGNKRLPTTASMQSTFSHQSIPNPPGYIIQRKLGSGAYATVYLGVSTTTPSITCAIKAINKSLSPPASIASEIEALTRAKHISIESLFEVTEDETFKYLVTEYAQGGELFDRIVARGCFTELEAQMVVRQLLEAVGHLHQRGVLHRDLKPENILLASSDSDVAIKIADFGIAYIGNPGETLRTNTFIGSPEYMPPEMLFITSDDGSYGAAADIWSIGIITYILLSGKPPHASLESELPVPLALRTFVDNAMAGSFPFPSPAWDDIDPKAKRFVKALLEIDPNKRATVQEALDMSWLATCVGSNSSVSGGRSSGGRSRNHDHKRGLSQVAITSLTKYQLARNGGKRRRIV